MISPRPEHPKVFISYSHDSPAHMDRVLDLSNRLRSGGIDCTMDQYEISPPEGWPRWMTNQIEGAHFVLVICTEKYERRFRGKEQAAKGLGGKWEGAIITQELYEAEANNTKFIPVVFSPEDLPYIPIVLRSATHYQVNTEKGYEDLYCRLTNQPRVLKPELGKLRSMPPLERIQDFFAAPWNVPYPRNPFFTGREDTLKQLQAALISGGAVALVQPQAISGLGGIGKTQTAVEYAYRYRERYKAVLWAKADSREALTSDFVAIAGLLDLPQKDAQDQNLAVAAVRRWLEGNTDWLLILDNADEPKLVKDYLPLYPRSHIIMTSRGQVFDVLGITSPIELDKMQPDEAKQFFLKRTGRTGLDPAEIKAIEQVAQELDYLPLALEQAGAYITKIKCGFQHYLSSYRKRGLELLEKTGAVTGKYPKSVATTWSLNFEQVAQTSVAAADLLCASAFLNPEKIPLELITLGAVQLGPALSAALANADADPLVLDEVLEPLTQYSLIRRDLESRQYDIHRLVQAVLKEGMDESTQRQWTERTVRAVHRAFPGVEFSEWELCERLLPHAEACSKLIDKWELEIPEGALLLDVAGLYLRERARFDEAESLAKRALAIWGPDDSRIAVSLNTLGLVYHAQGRYAEAEPLAKRALAICEKTLGPDDPKVAISLNNLAELYQALGSYAEAEPLAKRALAICEKVLGPDDPILAASLSSLVLIYHDQGKYAEAESLLKRALAIWEKTFGPEHPNVAVGLNNLAELYHSLGKYAEAELLFKRALVIRGKILGPDHPKVAISLNNLAGLYRDQDKHTEAESLYKRALAITEKSLGPDHPTVATILENYAALLRKAKRVAEATKMEARAKAIQARQNQENPAK